MAEEALRSRIANTEKAIEETRAEATQLREAYAIMAEDLRLGSADPGLANKALGDLMARINRMVAFMDASRESVAIMRAQLEELLKPPEPPEIPEEPLDGDLDGDGPVIVPPPGEVEGDESEQLKHMGGLLGRFGTFRPLREDAGVGAGLASAVGDFMQGLGLTPETLEGLKKSPLDRELTAKWATGITTAAQTGLGLIYSIGILTEVASLGQVDTVIDAIDNVIKNLGIDEIIKPLFTAPSYAALTIPVRQYWMSVFKPTVPPIQDLRVMAVREAFPVETREEQFAAMQEWGAYHGLDEFWMEIYLKAGYERMDVRTALAMVYWRLWDEGQLRAFLSIADIHPDDHAAIISTLWRNPTRYERRHGYIMGVYDDAALEKYFKRDGLSDVDAVTARKAMTAYALNSERNAVARAAGRVYRETLEELEGRLSDLGAGVASAIDFVVMVEKDLEEESEWVTREDLTAASAAVGRARALLGAWKAKAEPIRVAAEAELRAELEDLQLTGERQDLWVRRYAMEARVKTRPWEILEEFGGTVPYEPEA